MRSFVLAAVCLLVAVAAVHAQDERTKRLNEDQAAFESSEQWYYNDLERGFAEASKSGKPLLVVLRCVPCEACKVFDEQVAHEDPRIKPLLEQFVCVRMIKTNGLDLGLFQSDFDQSFAVFTLNADRTIYGRYGTRPETESQETEMSLEGFADTLRQALELHKGYPGNRERLTGKTPSKTRFAVPEDLPELQKFREFAKVEKLEMRMCIHCHMIRDAERLDYRNRGEAIPLETLFTWPATTALGFALDPNTAATVADVTKDSAAEQAGLRPDDRLIAVDGQAVISLADVKWALDHAGDKNEVAVELERDGMPLTLALPLAKNWRAKSDISSRVTTWDLRRMVTGGLVLESLGADTRDKLKLADDALALRVKYVGQYGEHAAGKQAGFHEGDVIVEFDGLTRSWRETDLLAHGLTERRRGDSVAVKVLRDGQRLELRLPMQ
jgi:serine protease Do